jgi:hypothetical protein
MSRFTRIEKLESRRRDDNEMLMLWRKPGQESEATALMAKAAGLFGPGSGGLRGMVWRRCSASTALDPPLQNRSHRDRKRILRSHYRQAYQQGSTEIDVRNNSLGTSHRVMKWFALPPPPPRAAAQIELADSAIARISAASCQRSRAGDDRAK